MLRLFQSLANGQGSEEKRESILIRPTLSFPHKQESTQRCHSRAGGNPFRSVPRRHSRINRNPPNAVIPAQAGIHSGPSHAVIPALRALRKMPLEPPEGRPLFQLLRDGSGGVGGLATNQDMEMFRHQHPTVGEGSSFQVAIVPWERTGPHFSIRTVSWRGESV